MKIINLKSLYKEIDRIKKKINIDSSTNIEEFLIHFKEFHKNAVYYTEKLERVIKQKLKENAQVDKLRKIKAINSLIKKYLRKFKIQVIEHLEAITEKNRNVKMAFATNEIKTFLYELEVVKRRISNIIEEDILDIEAIAAKDESIEEIIDQVA
jgi:hypothetical protein